MSSENYLSWIYQSFKEILKGMKLTWKHLKAAKNSREIHKISDNSYFEQSKGIFTNTYPHVEVPVPEVGRYKLHNEMDDCIVCDKCVKVCPVDCIEIEPIKATELVGHTSDGSPIRLYAAKFDIDMGKCCFCGLCTSVCPTECLTMTSEYDFSSFDINEHIFGFANLTKEEAEEKKRLYDEFMAEKEALKAKAASEKKESLEEEQKPKASFKPAFKPVFKPKIPPKKEE